MVQHRKLAVVSVAIAMTLGLSLVAVCGAQQSADRRLPAALLAGPSVLSLCKDSDRAITKAAYEVAIRGAFLSARPGVEPLAVAKSTKGLTCSFLVGAIEHAGTLWVRLRGPKEIDDAADVVLKGAVGKPPMLLGKFYWYNSANCNGEGDKEVELGMTPKQFSALPRPVFKFLCGN